MKNVRIFTGARLPVSLLIICIAGGLFIGCNSTIGQYVVDPIDNKFRQIVGTPSQKVCKDAADLKNKLPPVLPPQCAHLKAQFDDVRACATNACHSAVACDSLADAEARAECIEVHAHKLKSTPMLNPDGTPVLGDNGQPITIDGECIQKFKAAQQALQACLMGQAQACAGDGDSHDAAGGVITNCGPNDAVVELFLGSLDLPALDQRGSQGGVGANVASGVAPDGEQRFIEIVADAWHGALASGVLNLVTVSGNGAPNMAFAGHVEDAQGTTIGTLTVDNPTSQGIGLVTVTGLDNIAEELGLPTLLVNFTPEIAKIPYSVNGLYENLICYAVGYFQGGIDSLEGGSLGYCTADTLGLPDGDNQGEGLGSN